MLLVLNHPSGDAISRDIGAQASFYNELTASLSVTLIRYATRMMYTSGDRPPVNCKSCGGGPAAK